MSFFADEKFLIPFLATLGAAFTIIFLQFINRYIKEHKQKIYASSYMADVCLRLIHSEIILKKHTIDPHIEAAKRIIAGDKELLQKTFLADEFDILKAKAMKFDHLSEEYKLLIGYDDIKLVQMFDTLNYFISNEYNRESLNQFVKDNLKSAHNFLNLPEGRQQDVLNTYWDYLDSIAHESNRTIFFICHIICPAIQKYVGEFQFLLFSTKAAKTTIEQIDAIKEEYKDFIPDADFMERVKNGGIQGAI